MTGSVVQLSISRGGVPKHPILLANVTPLGIAGDHQAHPEIHGGPDQALLIVSSEAIDEINAKGYNLYPGALGENITRFEALYGPIKEGPEPMPGTNIGFVQ